MQYCKTLWTCTKSKKSFWGCRSARQASRVLSHRKYLFRLVHVQGVLQFELNASMSISTVCSCSILGTPALLIWQPFTFLNPGTHGQCRQLDPGAKTLVFYTPQQGTDLLAYLPTTRLSKHTKACCCNDCSRMVCTLAHRFHHAWHGILFCGPTLAFKKQS